MTGNRATKRGESACASSWRLLYDQARLWMARGDHSQAADVLRFLALAVPTENEIWDALAACHDAGDRSDIGDALRSLSHIIRSQTTRRSS